MVYYGMVYYGMVYYTIVYYGVLWYTVAGILWYTMVYYGKTMPPTGRLADRPANWPTARHANNAHRATQILRTTQIMRTIPSPQVAREASRAWCCAQIMRTRIRPESSKFGRLQNGTVGATGPIRVQ